MMYRSALHDSLHHFEHAFDVMLDLLILALSETLGHSSVIDGAFHTELIEMYSLQ